MEWLKHEILDSGAFRIPYNWLFIHYYEALSALFRVENSLRVFVYLVLKKEYGDKWLDTNITSDDDNNNNITIKALARKRIEQDRTFGYLGFPINVPLMHLTSGELVGILIHKSYWQFFKPYFTADKSVVTLKLQEIGNVRNTLAHFRPISPGDVEVVKQNAQQVLSKVETLITDAMKCQETVPTNTSDEWYKSINALGTDNIKLVFSQSADEEWINISLRFKAVILSGPPQDVHSWITYRLININTVKLLKVYDYLRSFITFALESTYSEPMPKNFMPTILKRIGLTFHKDILNTNYEKIHKELERVLNHISQEIELLRGDQLARGELLNITTIDAQKKTSHNNNIWWSIGHGALITQPGYDDPTEYWGEEGYFLNNFLSHTDKFPWMPVKISESDILF